MNTAKHIETNKKTTKGNVLKIANLDIYKTSNIIILGDGKIKRQLKGFEKFFKLRLIFSNKENLLEQINKKTIAVIVDESKIEKMPYIYLKIILQKFRHLPVYFLSIKKRNNHFHSGLYKLGLQGVINWPSEANILPELLLESLKPHPKAQGGTKSDQRLSNMIKSHLILFGPYKSISVSSISGFVFLSATVKTLWDKEKIKKEAEAILGVQKVITKDLKIRKQVKLTGKEIERNIKIYIGNLIGKKKKSIGVIVKNYQV
ncbi:hypothetical protein N9O57_02310, partial [bacterium]|nr:hypothetical protein [bacterium]